MGMHAQACGEESKWWGCCCGAANVCRRQRFKQRGSAAEEPLWGESVWAADRQRRGVEQRPAARLTPSVPSRISQSTAVELLPPLLAHLGPSGCAHKPVFTCSGCWPLSLWTWLYTHDPQPSAAYPLITVSRKEMTSSVLGLHCWLVLSVCLLLALVSMWLSYLCFVPHAWPSGLTLI